MPRLDGFGLIERLRAEPASRSADPGADHRKFGPEEGARRDAGATGWIVKPFDAESWWPPCGVLPIDGQKERAMHRELITFEVAGQIFGIDIMAIREIRAWTPAARLPRVPDYVAGVVICAAACCR
jgi:CheY-like chemotaxis protein